MTSAAPPAAKGDATRTGFDGQSAAYAVVMHRMAALRTTATNASLRIQYSFMIGGTMFAYAEARRASWRQPQLSCYFAAGASSAARTRLVISAGVLANSPTRFC